MIMEDYLEGQLNDKIEDLEDENTTLKEAIDDLMGENERLRKMASDYKILLEREVN